MNNSAPPIISSNENYFLQGGGEMGELIRSFDWSKTAVGSPDTWPQTLRIAVRIMLDCPFGMYIAWGNEYIQLYNDGYRPILGTTKHPQALGISTRKTFEEIWPTIGPMFDGVIQGTPVGFPDFILQLDRNGFLEECVFDFAYSPIRLEDGKAGGVLVTVIETTEKANNFKKLAESNDQLNFAIEATELGTWEYNPLTNKFAGNNRLKDWFGLPHEAEIDLSLAINVIVEKDRSLVEHAIQRALQYEFGGLYDIEYTIINPITKQERIVRAKGRSWFGEDKIAYRFNGTLQDITKETIAKKKIEESEAKFRSLISQAPVLITTFQGPSFIVETINEKALELWKKSYEQVINKPLFEVSPELEDGLKGILNDVYTTGEPYLSNEIQVQLKRTGKPDTAYFNSVYQPLCDSDNKIYGIIIIGTEVTEAVNARKQIEASEQRLSDERMVFYNSFMNAPAGISILKGDTHIYEFANAEYEKLVDRKIAPGKTVQELFPEIEQQGLIAILNNVFSTGKPFIANEFPVQLINKNTGKLDLHYYNSVIQPIKDEKGNTERLLSHGVEVTQQVEARKKIEEANQQLRTAATLTENIADAVVGTDMDHKTISWNKGAENLYGYASEEVMGKYAMELLNTQFLSDEDKQAWQTALDATGKWQGEVVQSKKDGTLVSVLVSIGYVYDENGKPIAAVAVNRDITERKKTEEEIAASEAKFKMLSETIPHMVWTATPDGKKNFFNKYFLEYTGLTFEEVKGDGWHKIIFPDDLEKELEQWHHNINTGEDFKIEKRVRHHNGTYRWHLSLSIPQKNAEGKITGWIGTNTDITEQKSFAEELEAKVKERTYQLHIQNETFKQAEESSRQGSYSFHLTTGKLVYSDNLYRLIGYEPNEFEPSLEEFNKHVHPDDRDYVTLAAQKVLASNTAEEWHYRMNTKTGTIINIKGTGRIIESGDEKLLVGTLQDVTKEFELNKELQEKEEYRRQIINNAPDAVIVINEKSIITLWNPKTEEIFGWKADEVLGLHLTDIIVPTQYRQAHQEGMNRFLKTGETRILNKTLELAALNKEGKEFPISITISQATQQGNKLFIAFLRDITLEKRTKDLAISNQFLLKSNIQLEASQKLSEKLLKQKDEFISIASHEMKTPLTTAKGYIELLLLSLSEENQSVLYAAKANQAVERLHDLVTELLDASKIQHGKLNYTISTFDFNKMVDETIENFQLNAKNHILQKKGNCSQQITGDRGRLQQVLINLLSNAVKYSPNADKVVVNIKEQDSKIQVSVQDFGVGISRQHLDKIFDRYYRVQEHAIHFQGLGIGLYISNNIIERHNGTMWAESEPEKGSTFYFTIPIYVE